MKWQCQWSRDCTARRLRCQARSVCRSVAVTAAARSAATSSLRASLACQTVRIESVPKARCGLSREQAVAAETGLLIPPE